jgi:uncharacterized protein YfbU (UPF0304 family)
MNDADPAFVHLRTLVRELVRSDRPEETDAYAELQAVVAGLYGLGARELEHVLATFPLIPEQLRASVRRKFEHSLQTTSHGGTETRRF